MLGPSQLVRALRRPEYFYRPAQIARRLFYSRSGGKVWVRSPWGAAIRVRADELHGRALLTLGIIDLRVSEMIWRLLGPGDHAVDVGANVGAMTSLMAHRVGPGGAVWAFEPHPGTRELLERSAQAWRAGGLCSVVVVPGALSAARGGAFLSEPAGFERNSGIARLGAEGGGAQGHLVETHAFDDFFPPSSRFRLVKIDVEGHEDAVLRGMNRTIAEGRVENIIFEEMRALPGPASETLSAHGYRVFLIDRTFGGPKLVPVEAGLSGPSGEPTNLLATRNEAEAVALARPRGWNSLRSKADRGTRPGAPSGGAPVRASG